MLIQNNSANTYMKYKWQVVSYLSQFLGLWDGFFKLTLLNVAKLKAVVTQNIITF